MSTNKFAEALDAILYIALKSGEKPVPSKEICAFHGLQPRHLEPLLQKFVHSNILRGSRGPKGGYSLAIEKRKIMLSDIYNIVREFEATSLTAISLPNEIQQYATIPLIHDMQNNIVNYLENTSIEDLFNKIHKVMVASDVANFNI